MSEPSSPSSSSKPPAGFYPDEAGRHRWWDGNEWTDHYQDGAPAAGGGIEQPKKKKRVFFWIFMAVQVLFLVWVIAAVASSGTAEDCGVLDQQTCQDAHDVGTGIGVFLLIVFWVFVDALMGIPYAIYRLAKRP